MARDLKSLLGEESPPEPVAVGESDWAKIRTGVTVTWLAGALNMDAKTVRKRIAPLRPRARKSGFDLYDLSEAMSYLVKPRFDIKAYIKNMNPNELPPMLRKEYWEAENKRINYEERTGELWSTDSVVAVLADAFQLVKSQTQVWSDDLERDAGLTPDQYAAVQARVDILRETLFARLCEMPKNSHHGSALEEGPLDGDETP